jgi:glucose-1-phosphate adenylyltransferase
MLDLSCALPRAALRRTMTVLLAGGQGSRLHELTSRTCKPALPLLTTRKGALRMVDFTMSNAVRSGLPQMIVATQYRPEALEVHLARHWAPLFPQAGLTVRNGTSLRGPAGYGGTADAVAANMDQIDAATPEELLVLSGDHIYQMDYSALIAAHRASSASVTMAVYRVPIDQARAFGVVQTDQGGRITAFAEKPAHPQEDPDHPGQALVSMGIYVFDWAWLRDKLPGERSTMDFGHDILPLAVAEGAAGAFALPALPGQSAPYWRDVGTLDSLRLTLLELDSSAPCVLPVLPGAPFRLTGMQQGMSMDAENGTMIDSVLLPGASISAGARIRRAVVAPGTVVPIGMHIGFDREEDDRWFRRTPGGTILITNAMLARREGTALSQLRGPLLQAFRLPLMAF